LLFVFVIRFLAVVVLCDLLLTERASFVCFAACTRFTVTVFSVRFALTILDRCEASLAAVCERLLLNVDLYFRSTPADLSILVCA
jgi:hypothetical protein